MTEKASLTTLLVQKTQNKEQNKVFQKKLLESLYRTRSVFAFLKAYGLDIIVYGLIFKAGQRRVRLIWLIPPVVVLCVKDFLSAGWDKFRFEGAIETLRDDGKPLVLSDPTRLPPWVRYPDVERCTWLNKILINFWPYIGGMVADKVRALAEESGVAGLELVKVSLGKVPPTVSGIKVYDKKVSNRHLVMDVMLSYAGDCEFRIKYRRIPGGLENFQLRGPARIDLLVVEQPPFIGGVEFSFLDQPQIDFVLTGVGSVGLTEETLRKIIRSKISSFAVFPQKINIAWAEVPEEKLKDPQGVIRVNVVEAKNLENKDANVFGGISDPYAIVSYGSKTFWSKVIDDNLSPVWDLWCEFAMTGKGDKSINIQVLDQDPGFQDEFIGSYNLKVAEIVQKGKIDMWAQMDGSKGQIHIRAIILEISPNLEDVKFPPEEFSFFSSFVLTVLVKSAHNLTVPRSEKKPTASVQLTVGNDTQETKKVENNKNPIFGECFSMFVSNPDFNKLRVKVVDDGTKTEIGSFSYSLIKLLDRKNMEIIDQHFPLLDSASESSVVVSMRFRVIKNVFF